MAIRVSKVVLSVLRTGPAPATMEVTSDFDHDYTAYDMGVGGTYAVEIGQALTGYAGGQYSLAGFYEYEGAAGQANYALNAYEAQEGSAGQGTYALNVYTALNGYVTGGYQLLAYVQSDGIYSGHYDLNTFQAANAVVGSQYELNAYLLAQGYASGLYSVEVYADLLMQHVSEYDLNAYEQQNLIGAQGQYDLNAFEPKNAAIGAVYAIEVLQAATQSLTSQYAIEVFQALEQRYGLSYNLNAYEALTAKLVSQYGIQVLQSAELKLNSTYDIAVFLALDSFATGSYQLLAYEQQDLIGAQGQYAIEVFVAQTGELNAQYILDAFQQANAEIGATYLLDTFEELYTWVVNHNTGAPARYEDYGFDAFARFGEFFLGAMGDGIYLLEGDDDDGTAIDAIATTANSDLNEPALKRVSAAYLGVHGSGQVHLTIRTDKGVTTGPYQLRQTTAQGTERAKMPKGVRSRYWQADIANFEGSDPVIDSLEFEVSTTKRRLKR